MRRLVLGSVLLWLPAAPALADAGHVSKLAGDAVAIRDGEALPLALHDAVHAQDTIRTQDESVVEITFSDESRFTVGASSEVVIDQFVYDAQEAENISEINIVKGVFRFASGKIGKKNPNHVRYQTPVSVIGIRGTEAFGEVKQNGHTLLGLEACCVDVISQSGAMELQDANTFSQVKTPYDTPTYPSQCAAAWLNKTARALGAQAQDPIYAQADNIGDALRQGYYHLNLRYRMEHVDDDAFAHDALANTLRTALDYKTARFHGMSAFVEIESTSRGSDDRYHDTLNGNTAYPVIADSGTVEMNQLYLAYEGLFDTHAALGRQRIVYDNQRFVGASAFRQDSQSFDALSLHDRHLPDTDLRYAYIAKVHTILPDDASAGRLDSDSHLINFSYDGFAAGRLTAYGYLIDLNDRPTLSSQTYGLRFAGSQRINPHVSTDYALEYARQSDDANNPADYDVPYYHGQATVYYRALSLGGGYEVIGSDGGSVAMQFPLATNHSFNGDADKFLTTPAAGLRDAYAEIGYVLTDVGALSGLKLSANYHDFSSEEGGADYGREWGAAIGMPFLKHYHAELRTARYEAEDLFDDTQKVWLTLSASF